MIVWRKRDGIYVIYMEVVARKIPSENYIYRPRAVKGRAYLYKDGTVKKYQESLASQVEGATLDEVRAALVGVGQRYVASKYIFHVNSKRLWRMDLTNALKATEDALMKCIGIDDSRVVYSLLEKKPTTKDEEAVEVTYLVAEDERGLHLLRTTLLTSSSLSGLLSGVTRILGGA